MAAPLRILSATSRCRPAGLYGPSTSSSFAPRLAALARHASTLPSTSSLSSTAVEKVSSAANPPYTTRPPPLVLPDRMPSTSTVSHLFATGKAYLAFYKTGMKYLFANTKLARQVGARDSNNSRPLTRSDLILKHRWQHDMRRLPLFGLLLLVCGEFTPLIVMVFPHVVPYPCRIPKQVASLRRADESRRVGAFAAVEKTSSAAVTKPTSTSSTSSTTPSSTSLLIARSLGLAPMQDRLGLLSALPSLAERIAEKRIQFLAQDDALLRAAGGAAALEADEVVLACADRGLDVLGKTESQLRPLLARWLKYTRMDASTPQSLSAEPADKYIHGRIVTLLTRRPADWP